MIMRRLRAWSAPDDTPPPPPAPLRQTYAVGDLHGRLDLYGAMLKAIARDAGETPHDIVFLGDYVDRGPESAQLLRRLMALETSEDAVACLAGNHERMLLDFLAAPEDGAQWLWIGGQETVMSFGLPPIRAMRDVGGERALEEAAADLAEALGAELRAWLAARPLWWRSGNLIAVHALTDPAAPMEAQDDETLIWARPGRAFAPRADGAWVVHGHTVVPEPRVQAGHVAVDTGAYRTGRLTAAVFTPAGDAPRFLQVTDAPA